jgi:lysophospholipid acyltransferase (LPLAT)-like uncharacterized protein
LPPAPAAEATPAETAARPAKKVHHVAGWKVVVLWLLGLLLRAWGRTLRVHLDRAELAREARYDAPMVFVFWHNRLFFTSRLLRLFRRDRPVVGLVSASRDGAVFAKFVSFLGVRTVRGSSSRFGREAVHQLIHQLQSGFDVVVTPDGPRGPMYDMKPGALLAARRASAPIVLVGIECRRCWTMRSWDRFKIPWPFARMIVRCQRVEVASLGDNDEALATLRSRLIALNGDRE